MNDRRDNTRVAFEFTAVGPGGTRAVFLARFPETMLGIFIEYPWAAAIVGGVFLVLYRQSRRRLALFASATWLLYTLYEYAMKRRILCTGECNIRIDLLLLYPLLLVVSLIALVSYARFLGERGGMPDRAP